MSETRYPSPPTVARLHRRTGGLVALYTWLTAEVIATNAERQDPKVRQALDHTMLTIHESQASPRTEDDIRGAVRSAD